MKKILNLFLSLMPIFMFSQKIGIVYNINPKMGYTYMKGVFKAVPVLQEEMNFDFIIFLEEYLQKKNLTHELRNDFDFSKLENVDLRYSNKKETEYLVSP